MKILRDENGKIRSRYFFKATIMVLIIFAFFAQDPTGPIAVNFDNFGLSIAWFLDLLTVYIYYAIVHYGFKGMFDYFDLKSLIDTARTTPVGAGLCALAYSICFLALILPLFVVR